VYEGEDIENGDETLPYSSISQAPYADSKIQAEKDVLAFNAKGVTQVCAIRPHVVFGPGDNRFVPNILEKAAAGRLNREIGNRDKLSDFTYIDNLVDAIVAAEAHLLPGSAVSGQAYFITNGEPKPFFGFVEEFLVELGYPKIKGRVPFWLAYGAASIMEGFDTLRGVMRPENGFSRFSIKYMVTHHYYSIEKARRDFGWQPAVTLAEGIRLTVQDLREKGLAPAKP
jgi:sterol-4alpha-carboxylate 3-dehydrogenase (decarboxylating)